jgi:hypothetical protein
VDRIAFLLAVGMQSIKPIRFLCGLQNSTGITELQDVSVPQGYAVSSSFRFETEIVWTRIMIHPPPSSFLMHCFYKLHDALLRNSAVSCLNMNAMNRRVCQS